MSKQPDFLPENETKSEIEIRPISDDLKGYPNSPPSQHLSDHLELSEDLHKEGDDDETPKDLTEKETRTESQDPKGHPNSPPSFHLPEEDKEASRKAAAAVVGESEVGKDDVGDDEEDGFKTPDSLEHRIPVMTECPPAPKANKTRFLSDAAKRNRRNRQSTAAVYQIGALFPQPQVQLHDEDRQSVIIKRRRTSSQDGGASE